MSPVYDGHTDPSYTGEARVVYCSFTTSNTASFTAWYGQTYPAPQTEGDEEMVEERVEKAKARYDKKRPVLSVRVSEAQKKQVEEMASACSKSVGRLVREGLDLERKDWREAYRRGFDRGCEETRKKYAVRVPCVCGHSFPVTGEDRIQEVEDILMAQCNWYHRDCKPDEVPRSECRLFKNRLHKTARQQESRPHGETP